jgi:hypothetical protein
VYACVSNVTRVVVVDKRSDDLNEPRSPPRLVNVSPQRLTAIPSYLFDDGNSLKRWQRCLLSGLRGVGLHVTCV